jgi:peptidoglycan/LPS O-acetylase OafA/YrhL
MEYRKDIQILRGLAVLLVVCFHLEIAGLASGFLGVDVFFVISGYLMAAIYDPTQKWEFYRRRARRLLPAYFATVLATLLAAVFITTPNDFAQVSNQGMFAMFFASNIGFWMENSYFDKAAFKPLLHLWSLGVEIQFYLFIPILYWAFRRVRGSYFLITAASAAICFVMVGISPKTAFFWLPFRLWEFLLGYGAAVFLRAHPERRPGSHWIGAMSLSLIVLVPAMGLNGMALGFVSGHPGLLAALVALATAITLYFGIPDWLTSNRTAGILEKAGNASYSIYLAHFPLIVLFLYQPFSGTILKTTSSGQTVVLLISVACLSAIWFKVIEQPLRKREHAMRWVLGSVGVVVALALLGPALQRTVIPEAEMPIYEAWTDRDEYRCGKINRLLNPMAVSCEITKPISKPARRVLFVGNSHADSLKRSLADVAFDKRVAVYFMVENNPLMSGGSTPLDVVREAQNRHAESIILHYSPQTIDGQTLDQLAILAMQNGVQLSFIMPVPMWDNHVPMMLWKHLKAGEPLPSKSFDDYQALNSSLIHHVAELESDKFRVYRIADKFCNSDCRLMSEDGKPLYFDGGHLTLTGSKVLSEVFDRVVADLL